MNHVLHACLALAAQAMLQCADADAAPVQPVFTNDTAANTLSFNDTFGHSVIVGTYNPITGLWTASGSNVTSVGLSNKRIPLILLPCGFILLYLIF